MCRLPGGFRWQGVFHLDEVSGVVVKEVRGVEVGRSLVVRWDAQMQVGRWGDDIVGFCVDFESVDLRDDWVDFTGEDPWGRDYFVCSRRNLFFDEERA